MLDRRIAQRRVNNRAIAQCNITEQAIRIALRINTYHRATVGSVVLFREVAACCLNSRRGRVCARGKFNVQSALPTLNIDVPNLRMERPRRLLKVHAKVPVGEMDLRNDGVFRTFNGDCGAARRALWLGLLEKFSGALDGAICAGNNHGCRPLRTV